MKAGVRFCLVFFGMLLALPGTSLLGQIKHPKASPAQEIIQELGLCKVRVRYSRPAVRGREIFGDLVPYGRIWRVGANESTKITFDCPVTFGGKEVAAGTYALYAFPEETLWEVALHRDTTHWGDGRTAYDPDQDLFRVRVQPQIREEVQENFQISFDRIDHNRMDMLWDWDDLRVRIPIGTDTPAAMEQEIQRALEANPVAQTYYEAGRYLQEQGEDFPRALSYVDKALELGGDTYYFHRVRSLLLAGLGKYEEAIRSAGISMELADSEGKDEFVRMNQNNIQKWQGILESSGN